MAGWAVNHLNRLRWINRSMEQLNQIIENGWVDHRAFRRLTKHVLARRALILNLHQLVATFAVSTLKTATLKELTETFYFFDCQLSFDVCHFHFPDSVNYKTVQSIQAVTMVATTRAPINAAAGLVI